MANLYFADPIEDVPGGLSTACQTIKAFFDYSNQANNESIYVIVGWHTKPELRSSLIPLGTTIVMWSHGVGATAFYPSRPVQSLFRLLLRAPDLIQMVRTLHKSTCLVTAYPRSSVFDTRSIDEVMARLMKVQVCAIGNPIDTAFWSPLSGYQHVNPFVLSIGRMDWKKGHLFALDIALSTEPSLSIVVLASEREDYYAQMLNQRALCYGPIDRLKVETRLNQSCRREYLRNALCTLCWSETEYQSLAILESLSCGCPVIARASGWLLNRRVPGILVARSQKHASALLRRLYSDLEWRSSIAAAGRNYVVDFHTDKVVAAQWAQLANEIHAT